MTRARTGDTELPEPFRELQVERVTKPDGRLLLYYSFQGSPGSDLGHGSGRLDGSAAPAGSGSPDGSGEDPSRPKKG